MFEKLREKREQRMREEQERIEREMREERERLMSLSEKELLVEVIIELRRISDGCNTITSKCDDIASNIALLGSNSLINQL